MAGKSRRLASLVKDLRKNGSRPLIFSQWKIMLDILEWLLTNEGVGRRGCCFIFVFSGSAAPFTLYTGLRNIFSRRT